MVKLVLVLMQVAGGVGEGGEGDGKGGEVGEGPGQEGGGDPERPRQHRSRREAQPLKFRLLQTFRLRSSVLEPDFHLEKCHQTFYFVTSVCLASKYKIQVEIQIQIQSSKFTCVSVSFS